MFFPVYYLTSSHKRRWFPFSFPIWFDILDFSTLPRDTTFSYSSRLTFSGRYDSHLYTLPLEVHKILSHVVFCWELDSEEIYTKSRVTFEYSPDILWMVYLLDLLG